MVSPYILDGVLLVNPFNTVTDIGIMQMDDAIWAVSECHYAQLHAHWHTEFDKDGNKTEYEVWKCAAETCGRPIRRVGITPDSSRLFIDSALHVQEWVEHWTGNGASVKIDWEAGMEETG